MRGFVLVAVMAVSAAQSLASEIDGPPPLVLGDGPTFEQLLAGTFGVGGGDLSQGRSSLIGVDDAIHGAMVAPEPALADEVQALIVRASTEDRQMQETQPDVGQDRPADSRNLTVIHALDGEAAMDDPAHAVAPKSDLGPALGVKSNLNFNFDDANSIGDDQAGKPLFKTIRFEAQGVAAAILFALWSLMAAVVLLAHYKQKAEQRRDLAILQSFSRKRVQSVTKPVYQEERALQARPDALPAHEWIMKNQTANSNREEGKVVAA